MFPTKASVSETGNNSDSFSHLGQETANKFHVLAYKIPEIPDQLIADLKVRAAALISHLRNTAFWALWLEDEAR